MTNNDLDKKSISNYEQEDQHTDADVVKDDLETWLDKYYKEMDMDEKNTEYSYYEMFTMLKKYLKILPKRKEYRDINNLI